VQFLTNFSVTQGNNTVYTWKKLYAYLFTKYLDGNIKTPTNEQNPTLKQPGYSEDFYRRLVKETGDKFKVIGSSGH
ncbi:MAG TPA: dipeptidase, partial [Bacteroidales bacterium]|nr:dipeptidase [Bacteroidales bacterium]